MTIQIGTGSLGCAVKELYGVSTFTSDALTPFLKDLMGRGTHSTIDPKKWNYAFLFADNDRWGGGRKLAKEIVDQKLGSLTESPPFINAQYRNDDNGKVRVWVWYPDWDEIKKIIKWEKPKPKAKVSVDLSPTEFVRLRSGTTPLKLDTPISKERYADLYILWSKTPKDLAASFLADCPCEACHRERDKGGNWKNPIWFTNTYDGNSPIYGVEQQ